MLGYGFKIIGKNRKEIHETSMAKLMIIVEFG